MAGANQRPFTQKDAKLWKGQLVCAVLNDGSYYIGKMTGIKNGELILSGVRGNGSMPPNPRQANKAQISGMLGSLLGGGPFNPVASGPGSGAPGLGAGSAPTGAQGGQGFWSGMWPKIRLGLGMMQYVLPLLRFLR